MATKKKNKTKNKNILPYILLPISMLVAGLIKVTIAFIPDLISFIAGYKDHNVYFLVEDICDVVGIVATIVVIALCSLCCKGLTKKIQFIASAFTGSLAYMLAAKNNFIYNLMYCIFGYGDDDVAVIVSYIVGALSVSVCFVLAVVIAELFFKKLSSYEEAPVTEGKKKINIKKMLVPFGFIIGAAVLQFGLAILNDYVIYPTVQGYYEKEVVAYIWEFGVNLLLAGVLIGSIFILKDKYRALTCVASASAGYVITLWSVPSLIISIAEFSLYSLGSAPTILFVIGRSLFVVTTIASVIFGVVFYILLNRKEMKKIDKTEN